eukprot:9229_1
MDRYILPTIGLITSRYRQTQQHVHDRRLLINGTQMTLSDRNFTYDRRHGTCPLLLWLSVASDDAIFGNFTDNCAYGNGLRSLTFDSMRVLSHKANSYGMVSLVLFKQYEYSREMGRVVKVSFLTLYLQFIYNGMVDAKQPQTIELCADCVLHSYPSHNGDTVSHIRTVDSLRV